MSDFIGDLVWKDTKKDWFFGILGGSLKRPQCTKLSLLQIETKLF